MKPRTAIIILIIVAIIATAGIYLLYRYNLTQQSVQSKTKQLPADLTEEAMSVELIKRATEKAEENESKDPDRLKKQQQVLETLNKLEE